MISVELAQSASRLFEALEKIGQSAGSGLQSSGPSGQPSQDLIQTFHNALNATDSTSPVNPATPPDGPEAISGSTAELAADPLQPGPAESMPPVSAAENAAQVTATPTTNAAEAPASPDKMDSQAVNKAEQPDFFMEFRAMPADGSVNQTGLPHADMASKGVSESARPNSVGATGETSGMSAPTSADGPAGTTGKTAKMPDDAIKELGRLLEQVSQPGAAMTPTDMYRLQYLVGMLKIQGQTGLKASQSTTQGIESVLRQSG